MPSTTNFGIIKKLKSIVRKTGSVLFRGAQEKGITEEIARKIQRTAYEASQISPKDSYTPPYKEIAAQLQVPDDTIYRAAVYRLANIAVNEERMAVDILNILENQLKRTDKRTEQIDYIRKKIEFIKQIRSTKP